MACGALARAEGPRGPVRGVCATISQAGMFFSGAIFPVGQSVQFTVELPQGKIQPTGEVRYHSRVDEAQGMGIRFTRLSQEDLARLQSFIASVE